MQNVFQTTIDKPIAFNGIGLHSGEASKIKIYPSQANQGIIFKRIDLNDKNLVEASYKNVTLPNCVQLLKIVTV